MPQAWQVRDYERQQFIEKCLEKLEAREENILDSCELVASHSFAHNLIIVVAIQLRDWSLDYPKGLGYFLEEIAATEQDVLTPLAIFSRSSNESQYILYVLLGKLQERIGPLHHRGLQQEEIENPEKIFNAPTATTELPIPTEE